MQHKLYSTSEGDLLPTRGVWKIFVSKYFILRQEFESLSLKVEVEMLIIFSGINEGMKSQKLCVVDLHSM